MGNYGKLGPYELRGELGCGAMARVWRAWDPYLQREVAIKEPLYDQRYSESLLEELGRRFVAEGRAAARLSHPGIVTIYAADVWEGRPAIVMELIEGETLGARLRRGLMDPRDVYNVLGQLLSAVGYAHARGVIHRDIKPENIFLTADGRVKLADFGIARIEGAPTSVGTIAGAILGTPGYMSPEQATGGAVDTRSDLFSVGVVAYEMLSGSNPFGAGTGIDAMTIIYRTIHEPVPELPATICRELPMDMRPAIMAALAKNPNGRPQTAEEFWVMLGARGKTGNPPLPWLPLALMALAVAIVLGVVVFNMRSSSEGSGGSSTPSVVTRQVSQGANEDSQDKTDDAATGESEDKTDDGDDADTDAVSVNATVSTGEAGEVVHSGSLYYLGVSEGKVAIFTNSSATPFKVSDICVTDLGPSSAAELDNHVPAASIEEAYELLDKYEEEAKATQEKREEEAKIKEREAEIQSNPFSTAYAVASSTLEPDSITSYYGPNNALDEIFETAWNEGSDDDGIGEWISINADGEQWARGVKIVNGYPKSDEVFYNNNRCKDVTIELSDGYTIEYTLEDSYREWQYIEFDDYHKTSYIKLTIDSVYKGSTWSDTSICEMHAY